ncbi:MAG: hypothetical protein ACOX3C_04325 [Bacilli bacterium]|jgi:hypothetical protein
MKKALRLLTIGLLFSSVAVGVSHAVKKNDAVQTHASEVTKRVWMCTDMGLTTWQDPNNTLAMSYSGGTTSAPLPRQPLTYDGENDAWYIDFPVDSTHVIFTLIDSDGVTLLDRTIEITLSGNTGINYVMVDKVGDYRKHYFMGQSIKTTTIVKNFAATIDTAAEACSPEAATDAINTFNGLATFEQNQYKALNVGGGKTGLDRLNYLKARYSITTPIAGSPVRLADNDNTALFAVLTIGAFGVLALGGYFFLKKKVN